MVMEMFKHTCRTCLSTEGEMVPIFSSDPYVGQIPKKLMAFIRVEISGNDALPKVICKKCMFLADAFYCFKEQCESADDQLKSLILNNTNKDRSLNGAEKIDSDDKDSKMDLEPVTSFKSRNSSMKISNNEAKNVTEDSQDTEDNYVVDYISDEVRIEVENASKRRQEAEKKISMEKVSQSIKNLKGIEVVPIGDAAALRGKRNDGLEQEEIVVFPVKNPKKRCKVIETLVIDDPPLPRKRLWSSLETNGSKVDRGSRKRENYIVYGKHKKLNFSTVRKVVKIDDEELCLEPKQEIIKESDKENYWIKHDIYAAAGDDEDKKNPPFRYRKESEFLSEKQEPGILERKSEDDSKDEKKNVEMQSFQLLNFVQGDNQNVVHFKESDKQKCNPLTQNEEEYIDYPLRTKESVKILASLESNELQRCKVANNFQNQETVAKCTIGSIIDGIDEQTFDDINQADDGEDVSTLENPNGIPVSFIDYQKGVFIENEISNESDNCPNVYRYETIQNISSYKENCSEIDGEKVKENLESSSISITDQVTPLALLRVNSSGEECSTINLKIYKRDDPEKMEETPVEESSVKDPSPISSAHQDLENSNLKFYQCTICSMNFISMPVVLKHNAREHMTEEAPFFCLICDKRFDDKSSLCEHVEEHNGLKPYKCNFCPKTFTLKRNLKRHVDHHINYKPFQCRICLKRFTEKSSLKSHMYLHTGNSPFACKSCNVSFNNKTNWRRHVITIHEKLTVVVCKFCNKELPDKRSLQVHNRVHTGDRPYQCPHCEKRFTQQCNLNTHIHCHLNDRPFSCPHCEKGFNQRGTRDDHILTHTGEKPHRCLECHASFAVSSALKRHMWIHTGKNRPYNCKKCKLQFVGLYDLRKHLKIRHGELVKSENPRVERVLVEDENQEAKGSNIFCKSGLDSIETASIDSVLSVRDTDCGEAEITAKENSSLSCNVNKIEDLQREEMKESFSETKFKGFNNEAKAEIVHDFQMSIGEGNS